MLGPECSEIYVDWIQEYEYYAENIYLWRAFQGADVGGLSGVFVPGDEGGSISITEIAEGFSL